VAKVENFNLIATSYYQLLMTIRRRILLYVKFSQKFINFFFFFTWKFQEKK